MGEKTLVLMFSELTVQPISRYLPPKKHLFLIKLLLMMNSKSWIKTVFVCVCVCVSRARGKKANFFPFNFAEFVVWLLLTILFYCALPTC